jgi:hypothetical protein
MTANSRKLVIDHAGSGGCDDYLVLPNHQDFALLDFSCFLAIATSSPKIDF